MGGRCGSSTEGQQHLWAQNDCYYSFLLLLLLSKPMSRPGTVHEAHRKAAKAKKRAWHKEGASKTAGREKEREKLPPTRTMSCAKIYVLFVYLFMQCFVNCSPHTAQTHSRTPSCTHIRLYRRSSCKFIHLPRRYNKYSPKNISFQRLLSTCVHFRWLVTCRHHYHT